MTDAETSTAATGRERRPPAVLQVLPRLASGGVERGTVEIAAALAAAGWKAVVASPGGPMVREIERAGGVHVALPLASKNPLVMRANIGRLAEVIRDYGIDIVHARSPRAGLERVGRVPAHRAFISSPPSTTPMAPKTRLKRLYNSVMARGERVIAISDFVAEHVASVYGVPRERMRVVHRGVDFKRFDPENIRAERIIKLMERMAPARRRARGHAAGTADALEGPSRPDRGDGAFEPPRGPMPLRRLRQRELSQRADSPRHIARARAGQFPHPRQLPRHGGGLQAGRCRGLGLATEPEGFGRVIVEAQAMGRPVIATAHGGAVETVLDRRDRLAGAAGRFRARWPRRSTRALDLVSRGAPRHGRARHRAYPQELHQRGDGGAHARGLSRSCCARGRARGSVAA